MPKLQSGTAGRIADDLRAAIAEGRFAPGTRLPPVRDLAQQYGVSRNTAAKAVAHLRDQGHITTHYGSGAYVRDVGDNTIVIVAKPGMRITSRRANDVERRELNLPDDGWVTVVEHGADLKIHPADKVEINCPTPDPGEPDA